MSEPRIRVLPEGVVSSLGDEAVRLVQNAGRELDPWQRGVLHGGLGLTAGDAFAADEVVVCCPRQNGKSSIAAARILLGLSRGESMLYTSHRSDASAELFAEVVGLVRNSPDLEPLLAKIIASNGREAIHMTNGARCLFGTRSTSRTGRGFSLDTVILDEAHYAAEETLIALGFTGYAREKAPQRWYLASAVDRDIHEHGMTMSRLRHRALSGESASLCYLEWSADLRDEAGEELEAGDVTPDQVDDETLWYQANPALGARVPIERVRAERESLPHRGFVVERLGIGAYFDVTDTVDSPISPEEWAELLEPDSKRAGEIELALDVSPDRFSALFAVGRQGIDPDLLHAELLRSGAGTAWVKDEVIRLVDRHDVREVIVDGYSGNLGVIRDLEEAGVKLRVLTGPEHAAACARLVDLTREKAYRHIGQPEVANALRGAQAKPLGDGWCWSRKNSPRDVATTVALTLALWGGTQIDPDPDIHIW